LVFAFGYRLLRRSLLFNDPLTAKLPTGFRGVEVALAVTGVFNATLRDLELLLRFQVRNDILILNHNFELLVLLELLHLGDVELVGYFHHHATRVTVLVGGPEDVALGLSVADEVVGFVEGWFVVVAVVVLFVFFVIGL
jgi:hypothetical protein